LLGTRAAADSPDESNRFESFIASVRERIDALAKSDAGAKALAREVLSIFRQIIRIDSDPLSHDDGIESLFQRLWGELTMQRLFLDLHNRASAVLHSPHTHVEQFDRDLVIAELEEIVSWYERRKQHIALLEQDGAAEDRIFAVHVRHDRTFLNVAGFEVACSLCLIGHRLQDLWLKVFVRAYGALIPVRLGWEGWVDETETTLRPVLDEAVSEQPVAGIVPITPHGQRCVLEGIQCFLPYAALDLTPGRHDVTLEIGVYDSRGKKLLSTSTMERVSIPRDGEQEPVPSPQSLGIWAVNPGRGDAIGNVRVVRGFRDGGAEALTVSSTLALFGHREELLTLEYRFLKMNGDGVEAASRAMVDGDGTFLHRVEFVPTSEVCRMYDRHVEIPLSALSLDEGEHELLCQVLVRRPSKRVLCGTVERFTVSIDETLISPLAGDELDYALPDTPDPLSDLQIGGLVLDPDARFNGVPVVKLSVDLSASDWKTRICRVVMSIEQDTLTTPSTKLRMRPQRQTLLCGGMEGPLRQSLISVFSAREIASFVLPPPDGVKLIARAQVYSLDDRLIFNRTRPFVLRPRDTEDSAPQVALTGNGPIRLVNLATRPIVGTHRVRTTATLNVRFDDPESCQFSLYHEVIDPDGRAIRQRPDDQADVVAGTVLAFDFSEAHAAARFRQGISQISVELQNTLCGDREGDDVVPGIYTLKVMIFSDPGKLLHVVHQPLLVRGKNLAESPLAISYDFDKTAVVEVDADTTAEPLLGAVVGRVRGWFRSLSRDS
jgi:hypothetical protein